MLRTIFTLAANDWRLFRADRRAVVLAFLVPVVLASAFGFLFDRPPADAVRLPLLVVNESTDPVAAAAAAELLASPRVDARTATRADAEAAVADRRPGVAVVFPAGFVRPGPANKPRLEILHNPLCQTEARWAEGVVTEVVMTAVARQTFGPLAPVEPPFAVDAVAVGAGPTGFNAYAHSFCGMTLQYLLFWGMECGLLLLRDRNRGVWTRLRAAPVPLAAVVMGKAVATAGVAVLLVGFTFACGYLLFGVTVGGSVIGFVLLAGAAGLLSASTGLLVAAVGGTEARARSVCVLVILGVSMFGGLWLPAFLLPGWAQDAALVLPTTWAMRGLDGVTWQGRGLAATLPSVLAVAGFAAVFLAAAAAKLRSSEARRRRGWV